MLSELSQLVASHKKSFSIFVVIGTLAAGVNFGSFTVLWQWLGINYLVSVAIAYILSVFFHFVCNRRFTFNSHGADLFQHLKKYIVTMSLNLITSMCIVYVTVEVFHLSPYLGIVFSIGVTMWVGYCLMRYWVFRTKEKIIGYHEGK